MCLTLFQCSNDPANPNKHSLAPTSTCERNSGRGDCAAMETRKMPVERSMWFREDQDLERSLAFIRQEFRAGFELVASIDRPAVSIFGSARAPSSSSWYEQAVRIGAGFAEEGFAVVTGGGPGIMEAANRGAKEGGGLSIGFGIELPQEQGLNDWLDRS